MEQFEELGKQIEKGVEAAANVELDQVTDTLPTEKIWNFAGPDKENYRLTLTKIQPHSSSARPGG